MTQTLSREVVLYGVWTVPCPKCGSGAGVRCYSTRTFRHQPVTAHRERWSLLGRLGVRG